MLVSRFKPPAHVTGETVPRSLVALESKAVQRIELATLKHLLGTETLIRNGSFYELRIEGLPTRLTPLVTDADRANTTRRLTRFEAEE